MNSGKGLSGIIPWHFSLLFLSDTAALSLSGFLAYFLRTSPFFEVHPYILNPFQYLLLLGAAVTIWHCLLAWNGGYTSNLLLFRIDELLLQFKTSNQLVLLLMAATFLYHQYEYSRLILFFSWMFFVLFGSLGRQFSHRIRESFYLRGWGRNKVVFAGENPRRALFEQRIRENPGLGIDIVPMQNDRDLPGILKETALDNLFLFEDNPAYEKVWELRSVSRNPAISIHLIPPFGNLYLRHISGGFFDGTIMISLDSPLGRKTSLFLKRIIDLVVSGFFLVLLLPLVLLIGILVKINSRGPVFFSQTRIGKDGVPFTIYKFRSMFEGVEAYATTPTDRADPRITWIGGILRSTGLDELPQLWNVFRGDMSLVGPRPEMPFIAEKYSTLEAKRLIVRPGISGLWQVYARTTKLPIHSHVEYDLYYIENVSLSLDLMILLDTIPTMILRTGI